MIDVHKPFKAATSYPTSGNSLFWCDDLGYGYLPSDGFDYGSSYWTQYLAQCDTDIGNKLTEYRASFVRLGLGDALDINSHCDVGIGGGQFVFFFGCKGYDINAYAKQWLREIGSYGNPYSTTFNSLSMWDVLEHIDDPSELLTTSNNIFLSMPIYENVEACLKSKHLKPNEHIWHFTHDGIIRFMKQFQFELVNHGSGETEIGREAIKSYYFKRALS